MQQAHGEDDREEARSENSRWTGLCRTQSREESRRSSRGGSRGGAFEAVAGYHQVLAHDSEQRYETVMPGIGDEEASSDQALLTRFPPRIVFICSSFAFLSGRCLVGTSTVLLFLFRVLSLCHAPNTLDRMRNAKLQVLIDLREIMENDPVRSRGRYV